jgi:hypothetical protein
MDADSDHVRHIEIPGAKVAGWSRLFARHPYLLDEYDAIALIDDDIETTVTAINSCFDLGRKYNLAIWQPGLSADSYVTYAASLANPSLDVRFVNCIEMMCPFFAANFLKTIVPLFSFGFESGIDLVWCSFAHERRLNCAVIDKISVKHTRPVGIRKDDNGFMGDRIYEDDIYACLRLFDMRWPPWVTLRAIDKQGRTVSSKVGLAMRAVAPFMTWLAAPQGSRLWRLKTAAIHLRHQIIRPAYYAAFAEAKLEKMLKDLA